ncbi:Long-chain-fatty-acid--CoA ligase [Thioalkalivibrio nitratireducens DSM 14787]|uniref:Long-chain-fatty-acid--CoA ligase n=1 Tax=Thioalkalivibrio nitratireducens (strain DSM 14787 / UNIQEM 213 / ALEN2) TaxID=1255043 RepID=L0DWH0_THIND|nr:AMP-dependent synthetase/ligase [Thioalkalivibrio nitratireducens]AGA32721.1 Long-chain-fatty-acid--CoA ligase [Thioalkalivibrio nitratireducens DSM 14787]
MKHLGSLVGLFTGQGPGRRELHLPERTRDAASIALGPRTTLDAVLRERVRRSPDAPAHLQFDPSLGTWRSFTWQDFAADVARWQQLLRSLALKPGDRVAMMLENSREWAVFDQAALGLGLVTVPLYTSDRAENVGFILRDSGARMLLIGGEEQCRALETIRTVLETLDAVVALRDPEGPRPANLSLAGRLLPDVAGEVAHGHTRPEALASIVYTSGTTGPPKGVMLSHRNFLFNVQACLRAVQVSSRDRMLSFLPLSHALERTVGYYTPIAAGMTVAYARSISQLAEDLLTVRPTILVAVPRIFERAQERILERVEAGPRLRQRLFAWTLASGWEAFLHEQGRGRRRWSDGLLHPLLDRLVARRVRVRFGGRLRFAISGGAPLPEAVGRFFLSLGVPIVQGYGLTETSPVISVNRLEDNEPTTVGPALPGVEVRVGSQSELLTRSPSVMMGYWNNPDATRQVIDGDHWFHTGDRACIGPRGHITITGRLKDILVLSNGEKVAPADVEQALAGSPLVEQVLVVGDSRPYLGALVVLREAALPELARAAGLEPAVRSANEGARALRRNPAVEERALEALQPRLAHFPGYVRLHRIALMDEPWTLENGLLTPTLKLRRNEILNRYGDVVESLYDRH